MEKEGEIYIAGHTGLVGSALLRELEAQGYNNLITRTHRELDLSRQAKVEAFFKTERPDYVLLAAARVGGIRANYTYAADFIRENIQVQTNVIECCHRFEVRKLCFLGCSCLYPKSAPQPIAERAFMTGPLEPTSSAYAVAKIAGIEMCQSYHRQHGMDVACLIPTGLYGPNDNFYPETSHVVPGLIRKMYEAKLKQGPAVKLWGTGRPRRELMHVDDLARAMVFLMNNYDSPEIINVGTGEDISIKDLAEMIKDEMKYEGDIQFDASMPDGTPQKLLDVSKIRALGWKAAVSLREGIRDTISWFVENVKHLKEKSAKR